MGVQLSNEKDKFVWSLTTSGLFTIKSMYLDLLDDGTKFLKKYIWKMMVPLKVRVLMRFLYRKLILTKDNLTKRNWTGNEKCCFCDDKESIQHLFFECPFAKIIWCIIHMTFGLTPSKNVINLFGNWLKRIPKNDLVQIRVGVCAVIWTLWDTRNDHILKNLKKSKKNYSLFLWLPTRSICGLISNKRSSGRR
jgi:hypothetical protein